MVAVSPVYRWLRSSNDWVATNDQGGMLSQADPGSAMLVATLFAVTAGAAAASAPPSSVSLDALNYFVGRWRCEGHFVPSMKSLASTLDFARDPETGALTKRHRDTPPGAYVAGEVWAVANASGTYRATIADAFNGLRWYVSPGWEGDRLTWTRAPLPGEPQEQFVYTRLGVREMRLDWKTLRAGFLTVGDTLSCTRA